MDAVYEHPALAQPRPERVAVCSTFQAELGRWEGAPSLPPSRVPKEGEGVFPGPIFFTLRFLWLLNASLTQSERPSGPLDLGGCDSRSSAD